MPRQRLRVGDRIRVISIPPSVHAMPPGMRDGDEGTLTVFKHILARRRTYRVIEIDDVRGWPWIKFRIREPDGSWAYHQLMVEPECVERVQVV